MTAAASLSSKFHIVIPRETRGAMGLSAGDEQLVLSKPDRSVIVPKPKRFAKRMAGLLRENRQGAGTYRQDEREAGWARDCWADISGSGSTPVPGSIIPETLRSSGRRQAG